MTTGQAKRALLVFPQAFYSFGGIIKQGLVTAGYKVESANDEYPANSIGKILGKIRLFWVLSTLTERAFSKRYLLERFDLVLIVKGRGLSPRILGNLKRVSTRIVGYNFDSFSYNPAPLRWYRGADRYCTFDYADAAKHALPVVDLFSSLPTDNRPKRVEYDISAIMRNHSYRLQFLDRILRCMPSGKTFIYIFEQNIFTFAINLVRSPRLYLKYRKHIYFTSLPYASYVTILRHSDFTIDYAHPKQTGITIRCFEAADAQTKIITNNAYVRRCPMFDESNTIVIVEGHAGAEARQRYDRLRGVFPTPRRRSVATFVADLLGQGENCENSAQAG